MRIGIALLVSVLLSVTAWAQQNAACLQRQVLIRVTGETAGAVSLLDKANFHAEFHGKPVTVAAVAPFSGTRRAVLVLDASGSMQDRWRVELSLAADMVAKAPDDLWLALLAFSENRVDRIPFAATGRNQIAERLRTYAADPKLPHGKTPLLDSIQKALDMLETARLGDEVYVISDGADSASKETVGRLERNLLAKGVRLFSILLVDLVPRTPEELTGPTNLSDLARQTGGWSVIMSENDRDSRVRVNASVDAMLSAPLRLELQFPEAVDKSSSWKLAFLDSTGKRKKKFVVHYPRALQPCKP